MTKDDVLPQAPRRFSHGTGKFERDQFRRIGSMVIIESGVLVFHPENIEIGDQVYIGHYAILKGHYRGDMTIGTGSWIGQQCFLHSAGGLSIGEFVGIGPGVKIITSYHVDEGIDRPILHSRIEFAPVKIGAGADIGVGAVILPGVTIGRGAQIGAGAVVTNNVPTFAVAAGVPARVLRMRTGPGSGRNNRSDQQKQV
jgi:acetyltransferase-like isoleucine patch superfamily enzyme